MRKEVDIKELNMLTKKAGIEITHVKWKKINWFMSKLVFTIEDKK